MLGTTTIVNIASQDTKISFSLRDLEKMDVADPLYANKVNEAYQKFKVNYN